MPFSSELGMNVYDPSQGVQEGQMAGRAAIDAFQEARRLKLDERKLKMIEEDTARKASATLLRQQGLSEMKDLIDGGMPFKDALFKVSPKLFVDNPEALGQIAHQAAVEKASETMLQFKKQHEDTMAKHYEQMDLEKVRQAKEGKTTAQERMPEEYSKLKRMGRDLDILIQSNPDRGDLKSMAEDLKNQTKAFEGIHGITREQRLQKEDEIKSAKEPKLSQVQTLKLRSIYKEIDMAKKAMGELDSKDPTRAAYLKRINDLESQADAVASGKEPSPVTKPKRLRFENGQWIEQ